MSADPHLTGRRVLAALTDGRAKSIRQKKARAARLAGLVRDLAHADMCAGGLDRGRAGRIKRKLKKMGRKISERQVLRILDTFSTVSDSAEHTQGYSDHQIHQGETLCTKPTS